MPAIGSHSTATVDTPWDGPAAVAAMPAEYATLHYCHAWWSQDAADSSHTAGDGDADDQKGSYKFPHHTTKGGPANIPGCRNGLARLEGSSIPDGDKPGVRSHLQAHISDANKGSDNMRNVIVIPGELRAFRTARPVASLRQGRNDWFRFENAADDGPAKVFIYDEIGYWGVTASDLVAALTQLNSPAIELHINSPGGDAFDGITIMNALASHPASVHGVIDGLAASAASIIAMGCDSLTVMPGSQVMIHNASGMCIGNAADMKQMAGVLDGLDGSLAGLYAQRAGGDVATWRAAMAAETWYTADEAVAAGLADHVGGPQRAPAAMPDNSWDLSIYAYAGRAQAPAPVPPVAVSPPVVPVAPVPIPEPVAPKVDIAAAVAALRGAFATEGGAA